MNETVNLFHTFRLRNNNACSPFQTDAWRIVAGYLDPIPYIASHYKRSNLDGIDLRSAYLITIHLPSSSSDLSFGALECDISLIGVISDNSKAFSLLLTASRWPTSKTCSFTDSLATCNTKHKSHSSGAVCN